MDTKKLRQKILDLAIRGKLVPQDPNDEPASVLLERIRAEKEQLIKEGKIKRTKKSNASDTSHYENVPFEVPESWRWVNIMEVLVKLTDGTHHSPKNYPKGKYKYITAKNIKNEGIVLDGVTYVDDETHHEIFCRCNPEYGDILYIKDGATTGVVAINNLEEEFSLLSSVALLKPSKLISNKYLFYYLQSSYCYESVRSSMKGVGITRITLKQIADWDVPIPPMEEQHRIVEYIDSLFAQVDLIAKDTATLKLFLEKCKHSILNLAIAGKLVPQDPSDEPAIKPLTRKNPSYKPCDNRHYENIPFELPETWLWVTLSDISNYGECANVSVDKISNESWVLELEDIEKDSGRLLQRMRKSDRTINGVRHSFQKGDVLYSKLRTYLNKVLVADQDGYCTTEIIPITCVQGIVPEYLCHVLRSKYYVDYTISLGYGVKMPRLGTGDALKSMIPVPPYEEQRRIVKSVNEIYHKLEQISSEL